MGIDSPLKMPVNTSFVLPVSEVRGKALRADFFRQNPKVSSQEKKLQQY